MPAHADHSCGFSSARPNARTRRALCGMIVPVQEISNERPQCCACIKALKVEVPRLRALLSWLNKTREGKLEP